MSSDLFLSDRLLTPGLEISSELLAGLSIVSTSVHVNEAMSMQWAGVCTAPQFAAAKDDDEDDDLDDDEDDDLDDDDDDDFDDDFDDDDDDDDFDDDDDDDDFDDDDDD